MTLDAATYEIAVLIGRIQGAGIIKRKEALFAAGCLAKLSLAAGVPINSIRAAIHPFDLNDAEAEADKP